jgi:hypothetical protein
MLAAESASSPEDVEPCHAPGIEDVPAVLPGKVGAGHPDVGPLAREGPRGHDAGGVKCGGDELALQEVELDASRARELRVGRMGEAVQGWVAGMG